MSQLQRSLLLLYGCKGDASVVSFGLAYQLLIWHSMSCPFGQCLPVVHVQLLLAKQQCINNEHAANRELLMSVPKLQVELNNMQLLVGPTSEFMYAAHHVMLSLTYSWVVYSRFYARIFRA